MEDEERTRQYFNSLDLSRRAEFIVSLTPSAYRYFRYFSDVMYSDKQIIPSGSWKYLILLGGRGSGKSISLCHDIAKRLLRGDPGLMLVTASKSDQDDIARDILLQFPDDYPAQYIPSRDQIIAPNKNVLLLKTAGQGIIKGRNVTTCYIDELSECWRTLDLDNQLEYFRVLDGNIRKGNAQMIITANPETTPIFRHLWDLHLSNPNEAIIIGSSIFDNPYLDPKKREIYVNQWAGTRYEKQRLLGELDWTVDGALWTQQLINQSRIIHPTINNPTIHQQLEHLANPNPNRRMLHNPLQMFKRIAIAVDPAMSLGEKADETGIVVAAQSYDNHLYVLEDLSAKHSPDQMAECVIQLLQAYPSANVVIETNQGGMYVIDALKTKLPHHQIDTIIREVKVHQGKMTRAQHVVIFWDRKTAHLLGRMPKLEQQMIYYTGDTNQKSPDRLDAMVSALSYLSNEPSPLIPRNLPRGLR